MRNQKKLQVFISSTFIDLQNERQAAVEAILKAGHIPAGMELFTASNKSQWDIIKRWIDESDIYMLILGGRYGSIEQDSGKSYTHLEYEYAQSIKKPLFAVVIEESILGSRRACDIEKENPEKLKDFRFLALSYMSAFFTDSKDIKLAVHESLNQITQENDLTGWVRGNQQNEDIAREILTLNNELRMLKEENSKLKLSEENRMPKVTVSINESSNIEFYSNGKTLTSEEKNLIMIGIPKHLIPYIDEENITKYINNFRKIEEKKLLKLENIQREKISLLEDKNQLIINILNTGNIKANTAHINIEFPDIVNIFKNEDVIYERISILTQESDTIIPEENLNIIKKLESEYYNKTFIDSFYSQDSKQTKIFNPEINNVIYNTGELGSNIYRHKQSENHISITIPDLIHNIDIFFDNYFIIPIKKGAGNIKIKVICEEYLEPEFYEIPVVVH